MRSVLNEDFRLEHPWRAILASTVNAFLLLRLELAQLVVIVVTRLLLTAFSRWVAARFACYWLNGELL